MISRILVIILLAIYSLSLFAEETESAENTMPESVSGITTISADELANLLVEDNKPIVIDARISKGRAKGYIDGSIHLPDIETNCETLSALLPDKNSKVVFYCSSSKCGRSLNSVTIAQQCNFKNLYWFRGGFKDWKDSGYPYIK